MKFLELHHPTEDTPILIAISAINFITPNTKNQIKFTSIGLQNGSIVEVKESYEKIAQWILTSV